MDADVLSAASLDSVVSGNQLEGGAGCQSFEILALVGGSASTSVQVIRPVFLVVVVRGALVGGSVVISGFAVVVDSSTISFSVTAYVFFSL